jgi:hypothetical protein
VTVGRVPAAGTVRIDLDVDGARASTTLALPRSPEADRSWSERLRSRPDLTGVVAVALVAVLVVPTSVRRTRRRRRASGPSARPPQEVVATVLPRRSGGPDR